MKTKIIFKSMNKSLKKKDVVDYNPEKETILDTKVELNKYIFPFNDINEESNVNSIGYINQTNTLFVRYKRMEKTVEGYELGLRPEPFGYFYHNVSKDTFEKLIKAKNKANYINKYIKTNYIFHREPINNY